MIKQELIENNIKLITLDAAKGNMLNKDDIVQLSGIISNDQADPLIKGFIITGANRSFCTGLDVGTTPIKDNIFKLFDELLFKLFILEKPLVVAATGHSIGGGLLIQLCADFVVISDYAKIKLGLPELKLNTVLDQLMIRLLEYSIGDMRKIQELLFSCVFITPGDSLQYHLADKAVQSTDVVDIALNRMLQMVSYNPVAFNAVKQSLRKITKEDMIRDLESKCFDVFNAYYHD